MTRLNNFAIFGKNGDMLHLCIRNEDMWDRGRWNVCPEEAILQIAMIGMGNGQTFRPHRHIRCPRQTFNTQESWVVIKGRVRVFYYDLNNELLCTRDLYAGDASVTFKGGHNYQSLEDDTLVYEFKNGPYFGQEADKEFI